MKRISVVIICIILFVGINLLATSTKYDDAKDGLVVEVEWTSLNLRAGAGENESIIDTLGMGEELILTGRHREPSWGGDDANIWYEVKVADQTGWVFADGIDW